MICKACADARHTDCPGQGRCDCQHRSSRKPVTTAR